jgi:hypothetical protein
VHVMAPLAAIASTPPESNTACARFTEVRMSSLSGLNGMGIPVHHMKPIPSAGVDVRPASGRTCTGRGRVGMTAITSSVSIQLRWFEHVQGRPPGGSPLGIDHGDPEPRLHDRLREAAREPVPERALELGQIAAWQVTDRRRLVHVPASMRISTACQRRPGPNPAGRARAPAPALSRRLSPGSPLLRPSGDRAWPRSRLCPPTPARD